MSILVRIILAASLGGTLACESEAPTPAAPALKKIVAPAIVEMGPTVLRGTLRGQDGAPMKLAHARLLFSDSESSVEQEVDSTGEFELTTERTGYATLHFTGVDHAELRFGVLCEGGPIELDIKLGTYERPKVFTALLGSGRPYEAPRDPPAKSDGANEPALEPGTVATTTLEFKDAGDGTLLVEVDLGEDVREFAYSVSPTSVGRTVNGTSATRYVYDGGGDYLALVPTRDGKARIIFDPKALPVAGADPEITFADPTSPAATVAKLVRQSSRWTADRSAKLRAEIERDEAFDVRAGHLRLSTEVCEKAASLLAKADDPVTRRALLVTYAGLLVEDRDKDTFVCDTAPARDALAELDPLDPLWALSPEAVSLALKATKTSPTGPYATAVIDGHPDPYVVGRILLSQLKAADQSGDEASAKTIHASLTGDRFRHTYIPQFAQPLNPARARAGQPVPQFEFVGLDGETRFTRESMLGHAYVLDFWATWCGPCIAELGDLHATYAQINGQKKRKDRRYRKVADPRLEVISISLDRTAKDVTRYRKGEWSMPWAHAFVGIDHEQELQDLFSFVGIPHMILVDAEGTIVSQGSALRGPNLLDVLTEHFEALPSEPAPAKAD